jgi:hypothetical protein
MKRLGVGLVLLAVLSVSTPSCGLFARKEGCPSMNQTAKTNRKGELSTKGGKSQLFGPAKKKRRFLLF